MAIYVDPIQPCFPTEHWPYRSFCHMFSDSMKDLLLFSDLLGLNNKWLQKDNIDFPHFDLTPRKRKTAIKLGAISVDKKYPVMFMRSRRIKRLSKGGSPFLAQKERISNGQTT